MRYELYGFSLGAASVRDALAQIQRRKLPMPGFVLTVGSWSTTDLDFKRYGLPFLNVFDHTGKGQRSPGGFIEGVAHMQMQRHVFKIGKRFKLRRPSPSATP